MLKDLKDDFEKGVNKLLQDFLKEEDLLKIFNKLGSFTANVADLRLRVTNEHLDPTEFSIDEIMSSLAQCDERLKDLDDLESL